MTSAVDTDLLAVHALGATDGPEAARVDLFAEDDAEVRRVLDRYRAIIAALDGLVLAEPLPPRPHVWLELGSRLDLQDPSLPPGSVSRS